MPPVCLFKSVDFVPKTRENPGWMPDKTIGIQPSADFLLEFLCIISAFAKPHAFWMNFQGGQDRNLQAFRNILILNSIHDDHASAVCRDRQLLWHWNFGNCAHPQASREVRAFANGRAHVEALGGRHVLRVDDEWINSRPEPERIVADVKIRLFQPGA